MNKKEQDLDDCVLPVTTIFVIEMNEVFISITFVKKSYKVVDVICASKISRMKILMVCLGNICRSPLAEGVLKHKAKQAGLNWQIDSAGTNGYHVGEAPHHLSQKVARLNGVDICNQKARRFVKEDFDRYDKIYAMADDVVDDIRTLAKNKFDPGKIDLFMNELHPGKDYSVPDPWYGPEPGYHEVYKMIDEVCDAIIKKYGSPVKLKG